MIDYSWVYVHFDFVCFVFLLIFFCLFCLIMFCFVDSTIKRAYDILKK